MPQDRFSSIKLIALAIPIVIAGGCVSYAQTSVAELEPTDKVRIEIDDSEVARLLAFVDDRSQSVSGDFVHASEDSISVVVRTPASYSKVSIPLSAIVLLERGRTNVAANVIGSAALLGGLTAIAVAGFDGGGQDPTDLGGTDEFRGRVVLISLPLSLLLGG
ncbi:MAG: hypothetical protein J4G12_06170 [Gemmatimonadetes bacterium]|nr:hypothetical protein [Gemmatimonadota bacterium]